MSQLNMVEALRQALDQEMERDKRIVIMGEDVGAKGGVFLVTDGLYKKYGDQRVIDTPLAESLIVGLAIGASINGLIPIAEIQFADFIYPAFDQIVNEAAKIRYRSNNAFHCPIVIRAPFGGGVHGGLYHSQSVESFFGHVPGLKVVVPSNPYDAKGLLAASIRDPDPVIFLEHKKLYRLLREEVPEESYTVPIGKANIVRDGDDVSLIAWGLMVRYALEAADKAQANGISVEVIDVRTISPLDKATILDSVRKTGKVAIVYEDNLTGGFGAEIAAIIAEHCFEYLDAPIKRIAGPDIPAMPFNHIQENFYMPNTDKVYAIIEELAKY
jgi:2-oxoisovalerate dehydrogenase E1 component beta subunit